MKFLKKSNQKINMPNQKLDMFRERLTEKPGWFNFLDLFVAISLTEQRVESLKKKKKAKQIASHKYKDKNEKEELT